MRWALFSKFRGKVPAVIKARLPFDTSVIDVTVQLTPDTLDGGWVAECLDLPGCVSQGETEEEALLNLSEAIGEVIATRAFIRMGEIAAQHRHSVREEPTSHKLAVNI